MPGCPSFSILTLPKFSAMALLYNCDALYAVGALFEADVCDGGCPPYCFINDNRVVNALMFRVP